MNKLNDFEDIPYEEEYLKELRYTEKDFQEMMEKEKQKIKNEYIIERMQDLEKEKEFYKQLIRSIFETFGGRK